MATDDPTAVNLPRLNVPSAPPPQPASTDPMEGLKDMARNAANSARAQFAPQPRPPVAPLLGPDAGSTVLPVLQDVDKFTRDKNAEALSTAKQAYGTFTDAVTPPSSNYIGNGPTDPDTNGRKPAPGIDLKAAAGQLVDRVGEAIGGDDYLRERTPSPVYNPFAVRSAIPAAGAPSPAAQPAAPAAPAAAATS